MNRIFGTFFHSTLWSQVTKPDAKGQDLQHKPKRNTPTETNGWNLNKKTLGKGKTSTNHPFRGSILVFGDANIKITHQSFNFLVEFTAFFGHPFSESSYILFFVLYRSCFLSGEQKITKIFSPTCNIPKLYLRYLSIFF